MITRSPDAYTLRWRYGTVGFCFKPVIESHRGHLYFSVRGTTRSESLGGKDGEMSITNPDMIRAIDDKGEVFWVESDGAKVELSIAGSAGVCVFPQKTPIKSRTPDTQ